MFGASHRDDNGLKRYHMAPPEKAVSLTKDSANLVFPDFFPWTGAHAEDSLLDSYIQHGFEDKPFLSNETGSARQSLYPALRQKPSLGALSSFMMAALEKRQELGRIAGPTTFKPPPRVTLTDHKREAWLRDLATPSVPLKRLSRTIPHGIRNHILIEQCCKKAVPIHRAVWFARCVGANELRGLKRKGNQNSIVESEIQWIREWTYQLTASIDKTAAECGQGTDGPAWRARMDYMVRFASYLYAEGLVDKTYFLDWTLTYLEKSPLDRIPLALLQIRLFWPDIARNLGKARRLAEILLHQQKVVTAELEHSTEAFKFLSTRLSAFIWDLILNSSEAFIIPNHWHILRPILQKTVLNAAASTRHTKLEHEQVKRLFDAITVSNSRLAAPSLNSKEDQKAKILGILNAMTSATDGEQVFEELLSVSADDRYLAQTICEWTVCGFHGQTGRISSSTALLKQWAALGKDIFESLFAFFDAFLDLPQVDLEMAKLFLTELVESDVLSAERYIRRIISRGIFMAAQADAPRVRCHLFILENMDLDDYPVHLRNQRDILLTKAAQPKAA
ncbi:transcription mediator complex subunit Med12-domain-containing protein [Dipodascopsis tothii]|uniref:transcription mediator complex subunit Med12-domain-containing protein n=1 Tax=Dipodascopsis tothii TaxID=44089 RepID=UPI0034CDF8CA